MWTYFFMFLSLVLGTFIGMGVALHFFSPDGRRHKPKDNSDEPREDESPPEPETTNETVGEEIFESSLTRKIPPKDFSVTDFNCAADEVEADEHIAFRQQTQDNAYNALKRRKK